MYIKGCRLGNLIGLTYFNITPSQTENLPGFFLEGKVADTTICVTIPIDDEGSNQSEKKKCKVDADVSHVDGDDNTTVEIKAHALVLAVRSGYFNSALAGHFSEHLEKKVEISLPDMEALEDFRLLLKLSCGPSYIKDGDKLLRKDVMLRMIAHANAFEFTQAMIATIICKGMTTGEAFSCFANLPELLHDHLLLKELMSKARALLPNHIGPLHSFFEMTPPTYEWDQYLDLCESLVLKKDIKTLSIAVMEAIIPIDDLEVQSEHDVNTLMLYWLQYCPHIQDDKQRMVYFRRLAKLLPYHHMSNDYLAIVVSRCPLMIESGLLPFAMSQSYAQRGVSESFLTKKEIDNGALNRAKGRREWTFRTEIPSSDFLRMHDNSTRAEFLLGGFVSGFPAHLMVIRRCGQDYLELFLGLGMPELPSADEVPRPGVRLSVKFEMATISVEGCPFGPWSELTLIKKENPIFIYGKCNVEVRVKRVD